MPSTPNLSHTVQCQRRTVLTTTGSFGDVHPYLALALGLKERGHDAIVATSACYQAKVEALGLGFRPVRPDSDWVTDPVVMRRFMHPRLGTVHAVLEGFFPVLRETYTDLLVATQGADLLVSHMPWAARLVAEKTGITWASTTITPLGFFSAYDLPLFPITPALSRRLRCLGPTFWRPLFGVLKWGTRFLARPWYRLRAELGLPPARELNPLADSHSPTLVLALFSRLLAAPQPDWPPRTVVTGFPLFDGGGEVPEELARFLDDGPPPVVFTLAVSAATVGGPFFAASCRAARKLGRRAVLIVNEVRHRPATLPDQVIAVDRAPFSRVFPRASVLVHAGGIGSTGLAMHAGRPMLVVPFAHDQPDNAERLTRLGIARTLTPRQCSAGRLAAELHRLLEEPGYVQRAETVAAQLHNENGVAKGCDALEEFLR